MKEQSIDSCISVITVCFNSEKTIARTFDSVLEQIVSPQEYIIIDGESTDKTCKIIERYIPLFLNKGISVKFISEKDGGIYDAMNKGIKKATGNWLHFLNSDDYYVNKFVLYSIVPVLQERNEHIIYGRVIRVKGLSQSTFFEINDTKLKINLFFGCPIAQPATFFKRDIFAHYSFDVSYRISADYKLFVELIKAKASFKYIPYFITCFEESGISSVDSSELIDREGVRLLRENNYSPFFLLLSRNKFLYKFFCFILEIYSKP